MLGSKLIACANISPEVQSLYLGDEDDIVESAETSVILKTTDAKATQCQAYISANHPYKTPIIAIIDGDVNDSYAQWMKGVI
jgi:uncharacterized protein involved in tolerance to divalent cations